MSSAPAPELPSTGPSPVATALVRPLLRGRLHAAAVLAAVPAAIALVIAADGGAARAGAVVYGTTLVLLFGASSAYHRLSCGDRLRAWLRRIDHSSIYALIAGSYTPICLVVLRGWKGWALLSLVWAAAAVGIVLKLVRFDASHGVGSVLYLAMGWAVALAAPTLASALPGSTLALLLVGGLVYTVGAVVLLTRFPDPIPRVFGYHEVWHTMVVVAGVLHYVAIRQIVA